MKAKPYYGLCIVIVVAIVYSIFIFMLPKNSLWINDNGNKFIILQNFLLTGKLTIEYPAKKIDPEKHFFPFPLFKVNGKYYSVFACYYPLIILPLYKTFGIRGIYITGLISAVCILLFSFLLLTILNIKPYIPLTSIGFATPLFFYSVSFWEHNVANMFMLSGIAIFCFILCHILIEGKEKSFCKADCEILNFNKHKIASGYIENWTKIHSKNPYLVSSLLFLCGALSGCGVIFREEGYLFFTSLLIAFLIYDIRISNLNYRLSLKTLKIFFHLILNSRKTTIAYILVSGFLLIIIPLWLVQYYYFGNILGIHGSAYLQMSINKNTTNIQPLFIDSVIRKFKNIYFYLFYFSPNSYSSEIAFYNYAHLLSLPFILAIIMGCFNSVKGAAVTDTPETIKREIIRFKLNEFIFNIKFILLALSVVASIIALYILIFSHRPLLATLNTKALFMNLPITIFIILFWREGIFIKNHKIPYKIRNMLKLIFFTLLFYIISISICLNRGNPGINWGPRHFLPIIPLLVILIFYIKNSYTSYLTYILTDNITMKDCTPYKINKKYITNVSTRGLFNIKIKIINILFLITIFVSSCMQIFSISILCRKKIASAKIISKIKQVSKSIIVTDVFYLPEDIAVLFFKKKILLVKSDKDLKQLLKLFKKLKIKTFTLILSSSPQFRYLSDNMLKTLLQQYSIQNIFHTKTNLKGWDIIITNLYSGPRPGP